MSLGLRPLGLNPLGLLDSPAATATNLTATLATWGWAGNAAGVDQQQSFTATTGTSGWVGNAASMNAQSLFQAPLAAWQWIGNAAGGFGSNSQVGGMVYGAVRSIVRRGTYGVVNRRGERKNK